MQTVICAELHDMPMQSTPVQLAQFAELKNWKLAPRRRHVNKSRTFDGKAYILQTVISLVEGGAASWVGGVVPRLHFNQLIGVGQ